MDGATIAGRCVLLEQVRMCCTKVLLSMEDVNGDYGCLLPGLVGGSPSVR